VTSATGATTHKNIVISSRGFAVYTLSGDSRQHPECTRVNGCFTFWPPVTIASGHKVTRAAAIKGTIGTWRRNGFVQLTLAGHPLYTFSGDSRKNTAKGEGIKISTLSLIMEPVYILGASRTDFKRNLKKEGKTIRDLIIESGRTALGDAKIDAGEIQAAARGTLPHLVTIDDIKGDLHAHSEWSDGTVPIEDMVLAARDRGHAQP